MCNVVTFLCLGTSIQLCFVFGFSLNNPLLLCMDYRTRELIVKGTFMIVLFMALKNVPVFAFCWIQGSIALI